MIDNFIAYIKTIVALSIFSTMTNMLMPDNEYRRYTELVIGLLILSTVLTPIFNFLQ